MSILLVSATLSSGAFAQEEDKTELPPIPAHLKKDIDKMKSGKSDRKEILKVAEGFLKSNDDVRASELYKEYSKSDDDQEIQFNHATALLKSNKLDEAMPIIQEIFKNSKNEDLKDKLRNNILLTMNSEGKSKDKNKKDDKKEDKKDGESDKNDKKDDQNKDGESGDKKDDKSKDGKGQDKQDQKNSKSDKQKDQDEKDKQDKDKDKDKDKKDPKDLDKPDRPDPGPQSLQEKEKMIEQKRKMVKTPAMVKQILNDDRELQKRMMDTTTNERGSSKPKRDW